MVTHYSLQKLIIDAAHSYNETTPPTVFLANTASLSDSVMPKYFNVPSTDLANLGYNSSTHRPEVRSSGSVDLMEEITAERVNILRASPTTSIRLPLTLSMDITVPEVPTTSTTQMFRAIGDVLHSDLAAQMANPVTDISSTTTSSHFEGFMNHILDVLPPPDLTYPSDEPDLNQPILTWETNYKRTKLSKDDPLIKPQDLNGELTSFLVIVDRFIPEKDGRRACTMCGDIVEVPSVVGLDDLQVLLDHLAHPRCWGKQPAGHT
ncbi:hypothetical protein BDM02DRAFT_3192256 [Thelephora ganbajun]|uniref:Uncharacterized protein n=1 Tax=Thelephora ganbajun TaxID=370292 RepID=A0ACB6Z0L0_THEGA|nr:hypothetical protein BDM02DRAFT_3192256 [Thelephora ganbajun]